MRQVPNPYESPQAVASPVVAEETKLRWPTHLSLAIVFWFKSAWFGFLFQGINRLEAGSPFWLAPLFFGLACFVLLIWTLVLPRANDAAKFFALVLVLPAAMLVCWAFVKLIG